MTRWPHGFRRRAARALLLAGLGAGVSLAASAGAARPGGVRGDPSVGFFSTGCIPSLRLEIAASNVLALRRNARGYVPCTVREGKVAYSNVAIHLKGAAGSFRKIDDKPALTLNFDKFEEGQRFHGMDKLHLNNSVQDPSYLTELVCSELFLAADVPTPRTTHARVTLNGRDLGLYVLKEGFDKTFLRRHFRDPKGNLYDGGFLREITEPLEKMSGEGPDDRSDLKALVSAANEPDPTRRLQRLERVLDMDRFLSFMALEIMTWHWDGYCLKRNNYRLYHDPDSGKMVFLPHGMDQMFWEPEGPLQPGMDGLVARAIVQTSVGRQRYRERVSQLLTNVFRVPVLTNRIHEVQQRLRPILQAISPNAARNQAGQANRIRDLIIHRAESIQRQLGLTDFQTLRFNASGVAALSGWQPFGQDSGATFEKVSRDGRQTLHIKAAPSGRTLASWRAKALLEPGRYRFEAQVRTAGVAPQTPDASEGVGIRVSGTRKPRNRHIAGDNPWTPLTYEFEVAPHDAETVLVCALRATAGEVWFDVNSLRLARLKN
jgi:hypothetical protein